VPVPLALRRAAQAVSAIAANDARGEVAAVAVRQKPLTAAAAELRRVSQVVEDSARSADDVARPLALAVRIALNDLSHDLPLFRAETSHVHK
jgi:hypothetical protein